MPPAEVRPLRTAESEGSKPQTSLVLLLLHCSPRQSTLKKLNVSRIYSDFTALIGFLRIFVRFREHLHLQGLVHPIQAVVPDGVVEASLLRAEISIGALGSVCFTVMPESSAQR